MDLKHGGNVWEAGRKSHRRFDQFLDFSSNINPCGPPSGVREALRKGFKKIIYYPDPDYACLKVALVRFLGVKPASIFVGNGMSQIIDLVMRFHDFRDAIILNPTYREYELACLKTGISVRHLAFREKENFNVEIEKFYEILDKKKESLIFFCNPNNPTGVFIPRPFFKDLLKKISSGGHWLVVDEAFIDFSPGGREDSLMPLVNQYPRLVVLWSLTKIFSIPGLRLGVAIANKKITERLEEIVSPWSVNILAEEAAIASLKDKAFLEETRRWIKRESEYLFNSLNKFKCLKIYPSQANFFLLKIMDKNITAGKLAKALFAHKILIRNCSNFRSLDDYFFRLAVKDRESNTKLISALTKYLDIG